jgi:hypothetical protein
MSEEPKAIAWMFVEKNGEVKFVLHHEDRAIAWGRHFDGTVIPLYAKPPEKQT